MRRLTIQLSERLDQILENLAKKNNTTKVDVLRRSIALMEYVNRELESDPERKQLSITKDGQIEKDIVLQG